MDNLSWKYTAIFVNNNYLVVFGHRDQIFRYVVFDDELPHTEFGKNFTFNCHDDFAMLSVKDRPVEVGCRGNSTGFQSAVPLMAFDCIVHPWDKVEG